MPYARLVFRLHAIRRVFERAISDDAVKQVLNTGDVIEEYPDDRPYASYLMLDFIEGRPIHVVAADNDDDRETIVITVYEPDADKWEDDYRRRRHS